MKNESVNKQQEWQSPQVFLSYSHDEREIVETVADCLIKKGFSCWIDRDCLRKTEEYNPRIDKGIREAVVFIAFLSRTYIRKPYCLHEFNRAIDLQKKMNILSVCIDDVWEQEAGNSAAYMFGFSAGKGVLGYGTGITETYTAEDLANDLSDTVELKQLMSGYSSSDDKSFVPIITPLYFTETLRQYHRKQYHQSGNYVLNEIRNELFSSIKNPEINVTYQDETHTNVSLIQYLITEETEEYRHILLTGEGGIGKTVSMLKTCEYLLENGINAIYIPLSKINSNMSLDQYLQQVVCGRDERIYKILEIFMSLPFRRHPNVVLILDGINEIPPCELTSFIGTVCNFENLKGVRILMSSRWLDRQTMNPLINNTIALEMQPLSSDAIDSYLINMGLPVVTDSKLLSVLRTPLMLTLYADVERHIDRYRSIEGITLVEKPDTAGKILSNFFQTQLYRAVTEANFDHASHLALLEFLLPTIAYCMVKNSRMYVTRKELWKCIDEIKDNKIRYQWYFRDRLRQIVIGNRNVDSDALKDLAVTSLHFLFESETGFEFLHQSFRDYFVAYFLANELWALQEDSGRFSDGFALSDMVYEQDIIGYVSDIVREENATPFMTETGWIFPGKSSISASTESVTEATLNLLRGKQGEPVQNAVANLFNIMKKGRNGLLAWCDFSELDLRKCWLNGCRFSEWFNDEIYPCCFNNSWINRSNFLTDGHESDVTAVFASENWIFSGGANGTVKIYDIHTNSWYATFTPYKDKIVDFAWDSVHKVLAILYGSYLVCYVIKEKPVFTEEYYNSMQKQKFRYVRFEPDGSLSVTYTLEPLLWRRMDGTLLVDDMDYDVPARCAQWNPTEKSFCRSYLLQQIGFCYYNEAERQWLDHTVQQRRRTEENCIRIEQGQALIPKMFLQLREAGAGNKYGVNSIRYSPDGSRLLVAIQNMIVEYDTEQLTIINKKTFTSGVQCADYFSDGYVIGAGRSVVLLDSDMIEILRLYGTQISSIRYVCEDPVSDGFYICSCHNELKKVDAHLNVVRIRHKVGNSRFSWVTDRKRNVRQMLFLPRKEYPYGVRYSYETDCFEPLGWCYCMEDTSSTNIMDEHRLYPMNTELMLVERTEPFNTYVYVNYGGISIFGCSFLDIHGDMSESEERLFLSQNGGITNAI